MPNAAIKQYLKELPGVVAEYSLTLSGATAYPHLEENARKEQIERWLRDASGAVNGIDSESVNSRQVSMARIVPPAVLRMYGIGVRFVKKSQEMAGGSKTSDALKSDQGKADQRSRLHK